MYLSLLCFQDHDSTVSSLVSGMVLVWEELLRKFISFTVLQVGLLRTLIQFNKMTLHGQELKITSLEIILSTNLKYSHNELVHTQNYRTLFYSYNHQSLIIAAINLSRLYIINFGLIIIFVYP